MNEYSIHIASIKEKAEIMKMMLKNNRQTMNLRIMPNAVLFVLNNENKEIIGWCGVDFQYDPNFPETFSLFVSPNYRGKQLGLFLKHACYSQLYANGFTKSFTRMEAAHNQSLIDYNLNTDFYRVLNRENLPKHWLDLCLKCELYQKSCLLQTYLEVDVGKLYKYFNYRLGKINNQYLIDGDTQQWKK